MSTWLTKESAVSLRVEGNILGGSIFQCPKAVS